MVSFTPEEYRQSPDGRLDGRRRGLGARLKALFSRSAERPLGSGPDGGSDVRFLGMQADAVEERAKAASSDTSKSSPTAEPTALTPRQAEVLGAADEEVTRDLRSL